MLTVASALRARSVVVTESVGKRMMSDYRGAFQARLRDEISAIQAAGTFKKERVISSPQRAEITTDNKKVLNFCANNYLGLSADPRIVEAAHAGLDSHGAGLSSVRFICGTQDIHKTLEKRVSDFHKKEDTILFPSCFDANGGLFEALLGPEDAVISDELNHASIIDGIRLCKATRLRYKHLDLTDLADKLKEATDKGARTKLVATDGVFSMDGDVAPLDQIVAVCEAHSAILMIDECHATGFFGKTGRGTPEYYGVEDKVDIVNSTFGKAMGGASGGYTSSSKEVVTILRQRARPYLFSNTIAPSVVTTALRAYDLVDSEPGLIKQVQDNTKLFRSEMTKAGFQIRGKDHPIAPVMLGDAKLASDFADAMLAEGIYVIGFSYPVVPKGLARIRVQLSAAHSTEDVQTCIAAFIRVGKRLNVIP
eukprot:TRINITY_DN3296_c0_g1_i1.p1 TRINITY_DN3296_c0_g1~~TRINITY_DN3296_c0_g1_i1.p1  ORF type:complete len:438 (+),score=205.23 TRINITY_DN3296_c0_g1_i1:44-1315(+)